MAALDDPVYGKLFGLTRSIHFADLETCYSQRRLIPQTVKSRAVNTSGIGKVTKSRHWPKTSFVSVWA